MLNNGRSRFRSRLANLVGGRSSPRGAGDDEFDPNAYTTDEPDFVIHRAAAASNTSNDRSTTTVAPRQVVVERNDNTNNPTIPANKTSSSRTTRPENDVEGHSSVITADKSYDLMEDFRPRNISEEDQSTASSLSIPAKGDILSSTENADGTSSSKKAASSMATTMTTTTTSLKPRPKYQKNASTRETSSIIEDLKYPSSYQPLFSSDTESKVSSEGKEECNNNYKKSSSTTLQLSLETKSPNSPTNNIDGGVARTRHAPGQAQDVLMSENADKTRLNDETSVPFSTSKDEVSTRKQEASVSVIDPPSSEVQQATSTHFSPLVTPIKTDSSVMMDATGSAAKSISGVDVSIDSAPSFTTTTAANLSYELTPDGSFSPTRSRNKKLDLFVQKANAKLDQRQEMIDLLSKETNDQEDEIEFLKRQIEEAQTTLENERVGAQNQLTDIFRNLVVFEDDKENNDSGGDDNDDNESNSTDENQNYHMVSRGLNGTNGNDDGAQPPPPPPPSQEDDGLICLDSEYVKRLYTQVYRSFIMRYRLETQLLFVKGLCDENVQTLRNSLTQTEQQASKEQQEMLSELSSAAEVKAELESNSHERLEKVNHLLAEMEDELAKENNLSKRLSKQHQSLETSKAHLEMDMMNQLTTLSAAKASMEDDYEEQLEHTTQVLEALQEELETIKYNYRSSGLFDDYLPQWDEDEEESPSGADEMLLDDDDNDNDNELNQEGNTTLSWNDSNIKASAAPTNSFDTSEDDEGDMGTRLDEPNDVFRTTNKTSSPTRSRFGSTTTSQTSHCIGDHEERALQRQQDLLWRRTQRDVKLGMEMLQLLKKVDDGMDQSRRSQDEADGGLTTRNHCRLTPQARKQYLNNTFLVIDKAARRIQTESTDLQVEYDDHSNKISPHIFHAVSDEPLGSGSSSFQGCADDSHENQSIVPPLYIIKRIATLLEGLEQLEAGGTIPTERESSLCDAFASLYTET